MTLLIVQIQSPKIDQTPQIGWVQLIRGYYNIMKSCDKSRDGSNQIGTISDHY